MREIIYRNSQNECKNVTSIIIILSRECRLNSPISFRLSVFEREISQLFFRAWRILEERIYYFSPTTVAYTRT